MSDNRSQDDFEDDTDGAEQLPPRRFGGGKYATLAEFEKGYSNSFEEVERLRANEAAAKAEADAYRRMLEMDRNRPAQRDPEPAYIPVEEEGVSRAHIQQLVANTAAEAAQRAVAEALRPLMQGATARTEMLNLHPDYAQREPEIHQFLAKNPRAMQLYQEVSQVNPIAGLELAYSSYRAVNPAPPANAQADQELDRGRIQAGMPANGSAGGRTNEQNETYSRKYDQLLKKAAETGDYTDFLAFRLRDVVPEGHLKRPLY